MGRGDGPQDAQCSVHDGVAGEQRERPHPTPSNLGPIGVSFEVFDQLFQEPRRSVVENSRDGGEDAL